MRLRDKDLLRQYMERRNITQARLARHAECSRQFIHMLLKPLSEGGKNACTPKVAERIEEALDLIPGTLFEPKESPSERQNASDNGHSKAAA